MDAERINTAGRPAAQGLPCDAIPGGDAVCIYASNRRERPTGDEQRRLWSAAVRIPCGQSDDGAVGAGEILARQPVKRALALNGDKGSRTGNAGGEADRKRGPMN